MALGGGLSYRALKTIGLFFVVLSMVLFGLFTFFVLPSVISRSADEPSIVELPLMAYLGLGGLFLSFSWTASRQRAAVYRNGFVPPDRRLREFARGKSLFVPFANVYHVFFFTDRERRNMLWTRVYTVDGRWFDLRAGEVGGEVMVALNNVARGTAVPGLSLSREYVVSPFYHYPARKEDFRFHDAVEYSIRHGWPPPPEGFCGRDRAWAVMVRIPRRID